jgi:heptaprenyl diphosphate synthase/octaprenyl-diphosphate synthase
MAFACLEMPGPEEVAELLRLATATRVSVLRRALEHALAGGKRLRAILVAAAAGFGSPDPEAVARTAAAMELIHLASLVHDDIIDGSAFRRFRPCLYRVFGRVPAVLTGDFLFASAFNLIIDLPRPILKIVTRTIRSMCEGEIDEISEWSPDAAAYFERVRKKTASLIAASCQCGGILGGLRGAALRHLEKYALHLGTAFQVADDILDFTAGPEFSGKPPLQDLRRGIATLPLIYFLETPEGNAWKERLAGRALNFEEAEILAGLLVSSGCLHRTLGVVFSSLRLARGELAFLPACSAQEDLRRISRAMLAPLWERLRGLDHPRPPQELAEEIEAAAAFAGRPEEAGSGGKNALGSCLRV